MQLVYGVLRNRQLLDRMAQLLSTTPLPKIDPLIHQALAVGLYQIYFLERIPPSAAVNETVECCRMAGMPKRLLGFVNGILRQSIREKATLAGKAAFTATGEPIVNHPEWLVAGWRKHFGDREALRICAANNSEPALVLRSNTVKITRDGLIEYLAAAGIAARPGNYAEEAVLLPGCQGSIPSIPGYAEGFFQVQDEAAQLATRLLGPFRRDGRYLDGCAGLGGKTSHLLQFAAAQPLHVDAVEPEPYRLQKLWENVTRLFAGVAPVVSPVVHQQPLQEFFLADLPLFAGILIDAPCSGSGVVGRHPDIRWSRRPEDLRRYPRQQLQLLAHSAELLAPGGILVYATCSLEPEENEEVASKFLAENPNFFLTDCTPQLPEAAHRFVVNGCFSPHPDATIDGFFAARLQRR